MDRTIPNIRHLRAFSEVASRRSISQASERIDLSQPAISQALAKLEQCLKAGRHVLVEIPLADNLADGLALDWVCICSHSRATHEGIAQ